MKALVPYLRQSRAKERTISIEEQRRDIRAWAEAAGVDLAAEVVEQNVSGSKPWRDRGLGDAVDACERGDAAGIIVAWQDRLSRENGRATAEVWEALEQAGARLVCAAEGLDTATGDHEMLFSIKAAIAREQWKRHRANWQRAKLNAAERGVPSGKAPIGYRKRRGQGFQRDPRQAPKVLEAFELRASGQPFSEIARRFGWSHSTCRQILANETYLGVLRQGEFKRLDAHDAIVPRELFDRVQASRTSRPVPPGQTTADRLLLGIARCGACHRTLKVVRRKRADGSYVVSYYCKDASSEACSSRAFVRADELDTVVAAWFEKALRTAPKMIDVVRAGRELERAQAELREAEAQLSLYVEKVTIDDPRLFQRGLSARERRVEHAQAEASQLSARLARIPAGGTLTALWAGFSPAERREVLAGFLDRVEIDRGASTDLAGNLRIFWSDGSIADDEGRVGKLAA